MRTHVLLMIGLAACGHSGDHGDAIPGGDAVACVPQDLTAPPAVALSAPLVFQVIGDVHGHVAGSASNGNIVRALTDLRAIGPDAQALVINGDLTEHGTADEYAGLTQALAGGSAPRLLNIGNHDYHGSDSSTTDRQRFLAYAQRSTVWLEREIGGYPFLLLGGETGDQPSWGPGSTLAWYAVLSDEQLAWLDARLTAVASPTRPTFVFLHQATWDATPQARLEEILRSHPGVVFFWSHYHRDLHSAPIDGSLFDTSRGFVQVHTGSIQYTWDNAMPNNRHDDWYQGLQLAAYPDRVELRGRDFAARAWIPQFERQLDQRPPAQLGAIAARSEGTLVAFVAGAGGNLVWAARDAAGAWGAFVDSGFAATSAPVLAREADGRLAVFALGADQAVWRSVESADGWEPWASLGGSLTSNIAVARHRDGSLELFGRGTDHALWHAAEADPAWTSLGGITTSDIAAFTNPDDRLEVVSRAIDNTGVHIWETAPGGDWSGWAGLGGDTASRLALGMRADGHASVFALAPDGTLGESAQPDGGGVWPDWVSHGGSFDAAPVILGDGALDAFVRGSDGALYHAAGDTWERLGGTLTSDPVAARGPGGDIELLARDSDGGLVRNRQQAAGGCWSGWLPLAVDVATLPY